MAGRFQLNFFQHILLFSMSNLLLLRCSSIAFSPHKRGNSWMSLRSGLHPTQTHRAFYRTHPGLDCNRHRLFSAVSMEAETPTQHDFFSSSSDAGNPLILDSSEPLFHPDQFALEMPKSLSPSAIGEFQKCPQSFLFQYIYKLRQPTNNALAQGTMCHAALEQLFDIEPENRTLPVLQNLFRREWARNRLTDSYRFLFEEGEPGSRNSSTTTTTAVRNTTAEGQWGKRALELLENYFEYEDPTKIVRPNPVQREVWVRSNLSVLPERGVTGYTTLPFAVVSETVPISPGNNETDMFHVRGIIDRLDIVRPDRRMGSKHSPDEGAVLRLVDYKTGKAPSLKYSRAMNERIQSEAFFQLLIYALLWRESQKDRVGSLPLRYLRLFYLTSETDTATTMDMDLGVTTEERDRVLQKVHAALANVWKNMGELMALQDPKAWHGCSRSFCYCHKCRGKFQPGTLWEPSSDA